MTRKHDVWVRRDKELHATAKLIATLYESQRNRTPLQT